MALCKLSEVYTSEQDYKTGAKIYITRGELIHRLIDSDDIKEALKEVLEYLRDIEVPHHQYHPRS